MYHNLDKRMNNKLMRDATVYAASLSNLQFDLKVKGSFLLNCILARDHHNYIAHKYRRELKDLFAVIYDVEDVLLSSYYYELNQALCDEALNKTNTEKDCNLLIQELHAIIARRVRLETEYEEKMNALNYLCNKPGATAHWSDI